MNTDSVKKIAVLGAGVMGRGIALTSARAGYETILFDIKTEVLDSAKAYCDKFLSKSVEKGKLQEGEKPKILERISYETSLENVVADLIIEAIPENLDLKQDVLGTLEGVNSEECIIASNTSTIPITKIAAGLSRPSRVVGMHFFNPAPIMKLVEVIKGEETSEEVSSLVYSLAEDMGKKPVYVEDSPGFVVNRVARNFYVEGLKTVEDGVADLESVDRLMEASGFRMGPFRLMDLIGIDTNHEVTKSLYASFYYDEKFRPSRLQQKKVDAGHWGKKSGKGFYDYS